MANPRETKDTKYKGFTCSKPAARQSNSKDTKRWCKGVVGREHQKEWRNDLPRTVHMMRGKNIYADVHLLVCSVCEKEFDRCYPSRLRTTLECKCGHH